MEFKLPALRTPADVLAVVPYLLGHCPADSLVVLGLRMRRVVFQVRADLPEPDRVGELAAHIGRVVGRQPVSAALVVGYGPDPTVAPAVRALRRELRGRGVEVLEALRAADGRYWSYLCTRPACCPAGGTPYDVSTTSVAASATVAGISPAASRDELVARLAPPDGAARRAIRDAARRAEARLRELTGAGGAVDQGETGRRAVDDALARAAVGTRLDDDAVAWLAVLLTDPGVRDYAWRRVDGSLRLNLDLWSEVVRRADPGLAAAPATLLAFTAWRLGEGALASIALDRAADADAAYPLARLLGEAIHEGVPPTRWRELVAAPAAGDRVAARLRRRRNGRGARGSGHGAAGGQGSGGRSKAGGARWPGP